MEIIKPEEYAVSEWAGGKTTQLYIYPQGSEYAKRNFLLRISSATVECERSEFTSLPQVERIILPLSGSLHLFYEGHGEKKLEPFEQDRFDRGICRAGNGSGRWKSVAGARTGGRKGRRKLPSDRRQRRMQIAVGRGAILTRKKRAGMSSFFIDK